MEALMFMFDVACMTYLCWRLFKSDSSDSRKVDFGFFRYRVHGVDEPPPSPGHKGAQEPPRA
jgi:hypothetical protein